jgi:hypothetical protein
MAGQARTNEFLLTTATVMIGPQAKVMELSPALHSLGLAKNVHVSADMGFTELSQGLNAQVVMSVNTKLDTKITAEIYEYTARNLAYGAGLDGSDVAYNDDPKSYTLAATITGSSTTVALSAGAGADFSTGDYLVIQDTVTNNMVHVGKVASVATDTVTLATGYTIPTGSAFGVATTVVYRVKGIGVGVIDTQPTYGAKLVGIMPATGEPVTLIFPKVKVTKGMSVMFDQANFANMPFEFTPYQLVASDPYAADFGAKTWKVFKR